MDQPIVDSFRQRLDQMMREGRALRAQFADGRSVDAASLATIRSWQEQCGIAVNELSGGSKAHWLARAFSEAFLVRPAPGAVAAEAPVAEILSRLLDVLKQASDALAQTRDGAMMPGAAAAPPHRFDFVHNTALRPVLERAYEDGRSAFDEGRFASSLMITCGVLEAIITDALEAAGHRVCDWAFDARIAAAEHAGMIRSECARLPTIARSYRERSGADGELPDDAIVTAREARAASQVLQMVMRDLNPGR
jgi:hypothetical protein